MSAIVDEIVGKIKNLQALEANLNLQLPITASTGNSTLTVDFETSPDEYNRGAEVLHGIITRSIQSYRIALAEQVVAESAPIAETTTTSPP